MEKRGRKSDGRLTKAKMMQAAVTLFLQNGYQNTTISQISEMAGMTHSAFFRAFRDKEAILYALIAYVFDKQFAETDTLLAGVRDPLLLYGVETALQLHITELSEALRDVYVMAYSLPTTSEYIYQRTAQKLQAIFSPYMPGAEAKDFYELEIASGSIMRGYMAKKCDVYFTMEHKFARFLNCCMKIYCVPEEKCAQVLAAVQKVKLHAIAEKVIQDTVEQVRQGLICADTSGEG